MKLFFSLLPLTLLLTTACTDDLDDDVTGEAEQAVSGAQLRTVNCSDLRCDVPLGDPDTQTCFLIGIRGRLASGSPSYPAGANIVGNVLHILNPSYEHIGVTTACTNSIGHRLTVTAQLPSLLPFTVPNATASQRCFLSGIYNYNSTAFSTPSQSVEVKPTGGTNYILSSLQLGSQVQVSATCFDATRVDEFSYSNSGSTMLQKVLSFNPTTGGTVVCGLQKVQGQFTTTSSNSGVSISYDSLTRYWFEHIWPDVGSRAFCVN